MGSYMENVAASETRNKMVAATCITIVSSRAEHVSPFRYMCYDHEALLAEGQLASIVHHRLSCSVRGFCLHLIHGRSRSIYKGHAGVAASRISMIAFSIKMFADGDILSGTAYCLQSSLYPIVLRYCLFFFTEEPNASLRLKDWDLGCFGNRSL